MPERRLAATLRALHDAGIEFILVGGLAAVLNGAPVNTFDVDVVHSRDAANIDRLLQVLELLDAVFRIQPERRLKPNASHLASAGHLNLITKYGPLDLLGTIGRSQGYQELIPHSVELTISEGVRIRVLDLETLIAMKEELGGEKDRAVLPILRRTLEEKRKRQLPGLRPGSGPEPGAW
jgi:predicted nucleotidyltransferase